MVLSARPATDTDLSDIVGLQQTWDAFWFGSPEHDEAEVQESFGRAVPFEQRTRLLHLEGRLVAAAWWWRAGETSLLVAPGIDPTHAHDDLLTWLSASGCTEVEALSRDEPFRAALERNGWGHVRSQFELMRDVAALPALRWPPGVTVTGVAEHADAVHHLIYEQAGWADIPGHHGRGRDEWYDLFLAGEDPEQQVVAWEGGRLVGAALGKTFSDGVGWVSQVAVAPARQGNGLGRALLTEAFHRRVSAGATRLGLGVSAANRDALRLYLSLGLEIDREWMVHEPVQ